MIGQHLILRCSKGVYDRTVTPGFKTAAVSENIKSLPLQQQNEINRVILTHSQLPDVVSKGDGTVNRGILRIFQYKGILFAARSFRVHDLCDTKGDVNFIHTYIIKDEDRAYLLAHPESFACRDCFDEYQNVNERSGGLNSGSSVTINDSLIMPNKQLPESGIDVFKACGFDEDTFSKMISSVCFHISSNGWTALILRGVEETQWNDYGGSDIGEIFLSQLMAILPNCITRFFSGVSFWNESPFDDSIKDLKVRILSGRYSNNLIKNTISLFDFQNGNINTNFEAGAFGTYLWKIRNDKEKIEEFHLFLSEIFGKNVDKVLKLPDIMNAITILYFCKKGSGVDINDLQEAVGILLRMVGTSLLLFPDLYELLSECIILFAEKKIICSGNLESTIVNLLKDNQSQNMEKIYLKMVSIIFRKIATDNAKADTVSYIADKLKENKEDCFALNFDNLIEIMKRNPNIVVGESLRNLFCMVFEDTSNNVYHNELWIILNNIYNVFYHKEKYEICIKICVTLFGNIKSEEELIDVCDKIKYLLDYANSDRRSKEIIVNSLKDLINNSNYGSNDETAVKIGKAIFGTDDETDFTIVADEDFFPIFIQILPQAVISDPEYVSETWLKQYRWLISTYSSDMYLYPEKYIEQYTGKAKAISLINIEFVRLKCAVNYESNWDFFDTVLTNYLMEDSRENRVDVYRYVNLLIHLNLPNVKYSLVESIKSTDLIYKLFLFSYIAYINGNENQDSHTAVFDEMRQIYAFYILKDKDVFYRFIKNAEQEQYNNYIADIYLYLWHRLNDTRDEETYRKMVLQTESYLSGTPYKEEVMYYLADHFKNAIRITEKLVSEPENIIALFYRGINEYDWGSKLNLNPTQRQVVEICFMIDLRDDVCENFFIEKLDNFYDEGGGGTLPLCLKRITRAININSKLNDQTVIQKNTLLSIVRICVSKSQSSHCNEYLKVLRGNNRFWNDSTYILYGMKYLFMLKNYTEKTVQNYISSFVEELKKTILEAKSEAERSTLTSDTCRKLYVNYVQTKLKQSSQSILFDAAKKTGNQEIKDMFKVRISYSRKGAGRGFINFGNIKSTLLRAIICAITYIIIIISISVFNPKNSVITAAAVFAAAILADVLLFFYLRKRRDFENEN